MIAQGSNVTLVNTREVFDPAQGFRFEEDWKGTETGIDALVAEVILAGGKPNRSRNAGAHEVTVSWSSADQRNGGPETPTDNYEIQCEEIQPSIWTHPTIDAAAIASGDPYSWRKDIEDFVKSPTAGASPPGGAEAVLVAQFLQRGGTVFASHQPVLSRQRTFSLRYSTKIKVTAVEKVYTTGSLVSAFGIPDSVSAQLPDDPTEADGVTPAGTVWAWKIRRQNTRYVPGLNKVEETIDWVFAAWPTWLYHVV